MGIIFSKEDIDNINKNPSEKTKIGLLEKLIIAFNVEALDRQEKTLAEDILRLLAADISISIRSSVAKKVALSPKVPRDVALKLASDLEDIVAIPVLEKSVLLTDDDIIKLLEKPNKQRSLAAARRPEVSERLTNHLAEKNDEDIVETLVKNQGAKISRQLSENILATYKKNERIFRSMIQSKRIDLEMAHELLVRVSEDLRKILIVEYEIPSSTVNTLIHNSKEWVVLNMIRAHNDGNLDSNALQNLMSRLEADGELGFSMLIRSLSLGNLAFCELVWAKLTGLPIDNIKRLLWEDSAEKGYKGLYEKSKFPPALQDAFWSLLYTVKHLKAANLDNEQLPSAVYEELQNLAKTKKVKNLDHLLTIVTHNLHKMKK